MLKPRSRAALHGVPIGSGEVARSESVEVIELLRSFVRKLPNRLSFFLLLGAGDRAMASSGALKPGGALKSVGMPPDGG